MQINATEVLAVAAGAQSLIGLAGGTVPDWLKVVSATAAVVTIVSGMQKMIIRQQMEAAAK